MPLDPRTRLIIPRLMSLVTVLGLVSCTVPAWTPPAPSLGAVGGELRFLEGVEPRVDLGPVVVLLDPLGTQTTSARPARTVRVESRTERFDPEFVAVPAGDAIVFENGGQLRHRVFTAGTYREIAREVPPGASSIPVILKKYGPVRFFCSLHPDESFLVYVAPTPYFALLERSGGYWISDLPPGRYQLSIWSPRLAGRVRAVEVPVGRSVREPIWIDPELLPR